MSHNQPPLGSPSWLFMRSAVGAAPCVPYAGMRPVPHLRRSPGFPVDLIGVGEPHPASLTESPHTQSWIEPRTGNPGGDRMIHGPFSCKKKTFVGSSAIFWATYENFPLTSNLLTTTVKRRSQTDGAEHPCTYLCLSLLVVLCFPGPYVNWNFSEDALRAPFQQYQRQRTIL